MCINLSRFIYNYKTILLNRIGFTIVGSLGIREH